jgi:quercetin dioxygenase-like cupin family protein
MALEDRPTRKPTLIVQTADVRVVEYLLDSGDVHPWHYHSEIADTFYCLDGLIAVETREPPAEVTLRPGEKYSVPAKVVHHVRNSADGRSRYLLVQGIGTYDYIRVE